MKLNEQSALLKGNKSYTDLNFIGKAVLKGFDFLLVTSEKDGLFNKSATSIGAFPVGMDYFTSNNGVMKKLTKARLAAEHAIGLRFEGTAAILTIGNSYATL
eukprot:TRINITY_DN7029_c0_g1_i7.p1 TRINITY_DN7029_c0_g1~~TRINITY_DN7029_c0_g1_i7.p1  ORF type:complete len:102 (+),score=10.14 TRINITY_DN7029_c0_g1_i7:171-476(+)